MVITLNNGFSVDITTHPKKNKKDSRVYDLYLLFSITQGGISYPNTEFSVSQSCTASMWGNPRIRLKGSSVVSKAINESLIEYETKAKNALQDEKAKLKNYDDIKLAVQTIVRNAVTGKTTRGEKTKQKEKLQQLSFENLVAKIKTDLRRNNKKLSTSRQNMYDSVGELLKEFFGGAIPLLPTITKADLKSFTNWYYENKKHKPETRSTYLGVITAIFNSAVEYELIQSSPIPRGFTPSVKNNEREERQIIEEDEVTLLYQLDDSELTSEELIAKYVMMLQLTTGMSYCDVAALRRDHMKKNSRKNAWLITKPREKNGEIFRVELSKRAEYSYEKLLELARGNGTLFQLPKLRKMNKWFEKLAEYAGVQRFTSYDLRHSFAVHFMDNGGRLEELAVILGHTKLETTRIYGKIRERRISSVMASIAQDSVLHKL